MRLQRLEELTYQGYQTVLVWAMTKSKKGRMPKFQSLLPKKAQAMQSVEEMKAAMEVLAMQYGKRIRKVHKGANGE